MVDTTPMMAQYRQIKERYAGCVLFFRLGDFYEMFDADARDVSSLLDLTLTQRAGVPMCGIPYHAAASYISRLLAAGRKIAVCEQVSAPGRGLMDREVVEVITPGTVLDDGLLPRGANNYLLALGRVGESLALAYADVSTGELCATSFPFADRGEMLRRELHRIDPRELITQESLVVDDAVTRELLGEREGLLVNRVPDWSFDPAACRARLVRQLGVASLRGFGLEDESPEIIPAGVLLEYLGETARRGLGHVTGITVYADRSYVELDEATQRNLELLANLQDGSRSHTLLSVLDQTRTAPGARKLRRWLLTPLKDTAAIEQRLAAVAALYRDQVLLSRLREALGRVLDLERLTARVAMDRAHAKDLLGMGTTMEAVLGIRKLLASTARDASREGIAGTESVLAAHEAKLGELAALLARAICEDPSTLLTEGNLIRRGYDPELDRLHALKDNARVVLDRYLGEERERTGISSLKLRFNRILGYTFEVTKSNLGLVPAHFIRRQSLVGGERYTTDRLADIESEINDASERIIDLERTLFLAVREQVKAAVPWLLAVSDTISTLDVCQSLAFAATVHAYTRPRILDDTTLSITEGRHPVVEAYLPGGAFVPNSLECPGAGRFFVLLTGPNMAGKSTFLRQTALIVLMAQVGSFVPASDAAVGLVDRIFCRVGATDNLARGESTFLVEMSETAHILRAATERSLVIMDEIGRGTGTRDGLAIAWAVSHSILDRIRARTLFATHFHELTAIEHPRLSNLSMDVRDTGGEIVFLKRVRPGPSSNSYGIHVAKLAGIPGDTLDLAERRLEELNGSEAGEQTTQAVAPAPQPQEPGTAEEGREQLRARRAERTQSELFTPGELILRELAGLHPDSMTPLDALTLLARWKKDMDGVEGK
jgi:DNA mismatch repair protein MutS